MCGIAGYMSLSGAAPGEAMLDAFDAALAHRGPSSNMGARGPGTSKLTLKTRFCLAKLSKAVQILISSEQSDGVARVRRGATPGQGGHP